MKRRNLLKALPLAGAALGVPFIAISSSRAGRAEEQTPIMKLFHEHKKIEAALEAYVPDHGADEEIETRRLFLDPMLSIANEIMSLPSQNAADFAAKAIIDTSDAVFFSEWETGALWVEARALTGCKV